MNNNDDLSVQPGKTFLDNMRTKIANDQLDSWIEGDINTNPFAETNNSKKLTWPLENIPNDDMAQSFIQRAVDGIIQSYREWWEENKEFKGVYVDPSNLLEHFRLDRFDSDDYSRTVSFSLTPDPIFHDDRFEAYGLKLTHSESDEVVVARVYLYGYDFLPKYEPNNTGLTLPALKDMVMRYHVHHTDEHWLFDAAKNNEEIFWHNALLQSVLYHVNREDEATDPMKAFLRVARPNQLPSEEEFVKTLDKIKLVEGLE